MLGNSVRFDLSDWLIHFFRNIDLMGSNSIVLPEHFGWGNMVEGDDLSAIFMLRCAIRQGRLWATWAYRNDVRTIYGDRPAVCFTEMPLAAFLESGKQREQLGQAMSPIGLIFSKRDMYKLGANPVIYGLDDRAAWLPSGNGGQARIFDEGLLPLREQYRYVPFHLNEERNIDWSHEREWRWPYPGDISQFEDELREFGGIEDASNVPGLDLYNCQLSEIGIVVKNELQALGVAHDILALADRGLIARSLFKFILVEEKMPGASNLVAPQDTASAIRESMISLESFFDPGQIRNDGLCDNFSQIVSSIEVNSPEPERGEFGGCWLWLLEGTHELTRALLASGRILVSNDRRYLVALPEFSSDRSLRQREAMTEELADKISAEFDIECTYYSVLSSTNPNDVPFYCGDHLNNPLFYNLSWK